eukprot:CAMPEP_0205889492 /NCGR_PEP_ID=MMETSP1083-20121108/20992_1 /ASSEMBLY_ACC=CAM_ASM_000430 /TAXON_ID=97485 /ORGANISM="Prymnesium parvum, Strain Texoma1" /LENGTH=85 /DNA_ID=CAMNT_0053253587 /DNA_START=33 /DNA_END=288 /DNA_ORIENTATION=+
MARQLHALRQFTVGRGAHVKPRRPRARRRAPTAAEMWETGKVNLPFRAKAADLKFAGRSRAAVTTGATGGDEQEEACDGDITAAT